MTLKTYAVTSSLIFLLVAVVHVLRLIWNWDVAVEGWHIPIWFNVIGILIAGYLSYEGFSGFRQARKQG